MAGLGGLSNIYGSDIGQMEAERDRQLMLLNQKHQTNLGYLNPKTQLAMQPGSGSNIMKGIGTAAGIAGLMAGGGASGTVGVGTDATRGGTTAPVSTASPVAETYSGMGRYIPQYGPTGVSEQDRLRRMAGRA